MAYDDRIRNGVKGTEEMSSSKQVASCSRSLRGELVTNGPSGICTGVRRLQGQGKSQESVVLIGCINFVWITRVNERLKERQVGVLDVRVKARARVSLREVETERESRNTWKA